MPLDYKRLFTHRLAGRARVDAEMDEEIESHLSLREDDLVRRGMSRDQARTIARQRFGDFEQTRRTLREGARRRESSIRTRDWFGALLADVRFAVRQARSAPGFTTLAILSLTIGIGASTAMFSLVDGVLLQPLAFPHSERLLAISGLDSAHRSSMYVSSADWVDWRRATTLESSALYLVSFRTTLLTPDSAVRVDAESVTGDFFVTLGTTFTVGRRFTESELGEGKPVAVVSERLWRSFLGADGHLSTPLRTAQRSFTVVGVVKQGQEFPAGIDVWFPERITRASDPVRFDMNWRMIGRRRADVTVGQVAAEVGGIARAIRSTGDRTAIYDYGANVEPLKSTVVGQITSYIVLLIGAVTLVLVIVCANVAASAAARATSRWRELAIRASLGAGRGRLVQQLLVEHLLLGALGGVGGLFFAWATMRGILTEWGASIPRSNEIAMNVHVFAFAAGASLVSGAFAGCVPALRAGEGATRASLALGGRTMATGWRNLTGRSLVTIEIALAMMLLTGAGLLIRSFRALLARDIGFETNVATATITLSGPRYSSAPSRYAYWNALIASLGTVPGVESVGLSQWIPLGMTGAGFVDLEDQPSITATAVYRTVNEAFFQTLRVPLVVGRVFDAGDDGSTSRPVVINHAMAERYWPRQNPLGRHIRARSMESRPGGTPASWLTVVGVVGDIRGYGLDKDAGPEMYVLFRQTPNWWTTMNVLVRGRGRASTFLSAMRARVRAVDPLVAADVGTLDQRLRTTLSTRTLTMALLTGFAGVALVLAALGVYGVLSYSVAQRTREMAIRGALGATRRQIIGLVAGAGLRVVLTGMALGLAASLAVVHVLQSLLVDVEPIDPITFSVALATLLVVSVAAIAVPARRASRLEPMIALQAE